MFEIVVGNGMAANHFIFFFSNNVFYQIKNRNLIIATFNLSCENALSLV